MRLLYWLFQWTWGIVQNLIGLLLFLLHIKREHCLFHGAVVTYWKGKSNLSMGMFLFMGKEPFFYDKLKEEYSLKELTDRLTVHEYGHTIQSLILGPLYLIVMGIPSTLWGFLPSLNEKRKREKLSYFSFFTEKWANRLGEKATGKPSMEMLVID